MDILFYTMLMQTWSKAFEALEKLFSVLRKRKKLCCKVEIDSVKFRHKLRTRRVSVIVIEKHYHKTNAQTFGNPTVDYRAGILAVF